MLTQGDGYSTFMAHYQNIMCACICTWLVMSEGMGEGGLE